MRRFLSQVSRLHDDEIGSAAFYTLDRVDAKTAALLNHVSIMIAILIVTYLRASHVARLYLALRLEIVAYLIIALLCLVGISISAPRHTLEGDDWEARLGHVFLRIQAFRASLAATVVTTLAFVLTLALEPLGAFGSR